MRVDRTGSVEYTADSFEMRSSFLRHAYEEHQDFLMLEDNYVSVGGRREDIVNAEKNIGSEALSAWMFHKSSCENPVDLFGAMFIIEGLGHRLAAKWGKAIQKQLDLDPEQVSFYCITAKMMTIISTACGILSGLST